MTDVAEAPEATPYDLLGGREALRRVVEAFYDVMDSDPAAVGVRAMHAADLGPMRDKLVDWLSGWMGGPKVYFQRPDAGCIVSAHKRFTIGEAERDQWMACMRRAFELAELTPEMRRMLDTPFALMAEAFRNQ